MTNDLLDRNTPIQITSNSPFFEAMCRTWTDSATVVNLMKREAAQQVRYATQVAAQVATDRVIRMRTHSIEVNIKPTRADTTPLPQVHLEDWAQDTDAHMQALSEAWATDKPKRKKFRRLRNLTAGLYIVACIVLWREQ